MGTDPFAELVEEMDESWMAAPGDRVHHVLDSIAALARSRSKARKPRVYDGRLVNRRLLSG